MMEYYDLAKVGVASSPPDKPFGGQARLPCLTAGRESRFSLKKSTSVN